VFVGEIVGATLLPLLSGKLAQTYGLGITMWIAAAGMILVFLLTYVMKGVEPWKRKLQETHATL
jgi:dipeptide/tripeptide permease